MITLRHRIAILLLIAFTSLTLTTGTAFAAPKNDKVKPGWGKGDKNHEHSGPPGQSVRPPKNVVNNNFSIIVEAGAKVKNIAVYVINFFN